MMLAAGIVGGIITGGIALIALRMAITAQNARLRKVRARSIACRDHASALAAKCERQGRLEDAVVVRDCISVMGDYIALTAEGGREEGCGPHPPRQRTPRSPLSVPEREKATAQGERRA